MVSTSPGSTKHVLCLPGSEVTSCNARAQLVHTHTEAAEKTAGKAHADEDFLAIMQCMHVLQMLAQAAQFGWHCQCQSALGLQIIMEVATTAYVEQPN